MGRVAAPVRRARLGQGPAVVGRAGRRCSTSRSGGCARDDADAWQPHDVRRAGCSQARSWRELDGLATREAAAALRGARSRRAARRAAGAGGDEYLLGRPGRPDGREPRRVTRSGRSSTVVGKRRASDRCASRGQRRRRAADSVRRRSTSTASISRAARSTSTGSADY